MVGGGDVGSVVNVAAGRPEKRSLQNIGVG